MEAWKPMQNVLNEKERCVYAEGFMYLMEPHTFDSLVGKLAASEANIAIMQMLCDND